MNHTEGTLRSRSLYMTLAAIALSAISGVASAGDSPAVTYHERADDLPFAEAVEVGRHLYLSGAIGVEPGSLSLVDGGIAAEARQTMDNIESTLEKHGYGMDDLVKCTVMLADISEWEAFNEVYSSYFDDRYPARSAFGVEGLALDARVEVECMAAH